MAMSLDIAPAAPSARATTPVSLTTSCEMFGPASHNSGKRLARLNEVREGQRKIYEFTITSAQRRKRSVCLSALVWGPQSTQASSSNIQAPAVLVCLSSECVQPHDGSTPYHEFPVPLWLDAYCVPSDNLNWLSTSLAYPANICIV